MKTVRRFISIATAQPRQSVEPISLNVSPLQRMRATAAFRLFATIAAMCVSLGASMEAQALPVIVNGNFESTVSTLGPGAEPVTTASLPGWTPTYVSAVGTNVSLLKAESGDWGINAQSGNQYIVMGGGGQNGASLSQLVNGFVVGDTYDLSFWLTTQQLANGSYTESIRLNLGNEFAQTFSVTQSNASIAWVQFTYSFVASATAYNVSFTDLGDPGDLLSNAGFDNVSIARVNTGGGGGNNVPLPAPVALLGLGLLAIGARRARSRAR